MSEAPTALGNYLGAIEYILQDQAPEKHTVGGIVAKSLDQYERASRHLYAHRQAVGNEERIQWPVRMNCDD